MKYSKYLPVGSIVTLKDGESKIMITGFCFIPKEIPRQMYDYSGCVYPNGFMESNKILVFNHNQIEKVHFVGLMNDKEEIKFKQKLNDYIATVIKLKEIDLPN